MEGKKIEHDSLEKRSEKDLWCQDLDAFIHEWEVQLKEEADYQKAARSTNRRASKKIGAGKTAGRGKAKAADNEYNPKPSKPLKAVAKVVEKPKVSRFDPSFFGAPNSKKTSMGSDGVEDDEAKHELSSDDDFEALKPVKAAEKPKEKESSTSRGASEQPAPTANGRTKRAAAAAPKKWVVDDDEESESEISFGDIGNMVKGINGGEKPTDTRLSLFAMSARPDSSHGRATSNDLPKLKAKPSKVFTFEDSEEDQTNYEMLAKSSPQKTAPPTRNNLDSFLSSDNDDIVVPKKAPAKVAARPAAKRPVISDDDDEDVLVPKKVVKKPAAAPKPAVVQGSLLSDDDDESVLVSKKVVKKPAAPKAAPKVVDLSEDEDDEVQGLISSDEDEDLKPITKKAPAKAVKPAPKPKKALAPKKAAEPVKKANALSPAAKAHAKKQSKLRAAFSEDEDDLDLDVEMDGGNSPEPAPKVTGGRGRPARAATKVEKKKPVYVDPEDEDMDVDDDESEVVEDEESDDFDESE